MRIIILVLLLLPFFSFSQLEKKTLKAVKTEAAFEIDGYFNEAAWKQAPVAKNFREFEPGNGDTIPEAFATTARVLYSDEAVYFALVMRDPQPDSILRQFTERDDLDGNADFILIGINPFNDGLSDFNFGLTAAGTQVDSRTTANGDDFSLNSIWTSAVRITDSGWVAEIRIPYISLRFPQNIKKDWGLNILRSIRRSRITYSWNFIDRSTGYNPEYMAGLLTGVEDIDPPIRLTLMPYISAYANDFKGETNYDFNAGLDLKYGINQSFTLDMTLIPDFGQVAFDNQFLNLSPFENRFQENRQFFVEGTELFTIGDLFYSRRIGGAPKNITNQNLNDSDVVEVRTEYTRLLNATKISGRTPGNLGIGFLNAITDNNYTTTVDEDGSTRQQLLEPLTNYNVMVLDQRFNRNSSVSFVNTNVLRNGQYTDANVSALLANLYTPSGQYLLNASIKRSDRFSQSEQATGYEGSVRFGDVDGNWRWGSLQRITTDDFNVNDLGFQTRNNQIRNYSELEYRTFKPSGPFNRTSYSVYSIISHLYAPQRYEEFVLGLNTFFLLRDFTGTGLEFRTNPVASYDYFEPRLPGAFFKNPPSWSFTYFISTDYRKPLALDLRFYHRNTPQFSRDSWYADIEPRIRLGNHFFVIPQVVFNYALNDRGFADIVNGESIFGRRDIKSITTLIEGRYVFNPVSTLSLRLRQYWSRLVYKDLYELQSNGTLMKSDVNEDYDINFNTLNLDVRYSWWFAPASEMTFLFRLAIAQDGDKVETNYIENFQNTLASPIQNNISIKINYLLDYNRTRNFIKARG